MVRTTLALCLCAAGIATVAWFAGATRAAATCQAEQSAATARTAAEHARQVESYRRAEHALRGQLDAATEYHQQELARLERSTIDLAARLRAGAVRVSLPAASCTVEAAAAADPGLGDRTARAELAPETALALDRIAADGDAAIVDLNLCLAAYEAARAAVVAAGDTAR